MRTNFETGQRRGFCPSLWTPMESGDGLLVRVRARRPRSARGIRASEVRALAQLAAEHGNGLLEATRRARLQVRGVRTESLAALQRAVVELGLADESAVLERSADALIVNPWSGLSPACASLDAIASEIEYALAESRVCEGASSKLGVVLDSGNLLCGIAADVHVDVQPQNLHRAQIRVAAGAARWADLGECDVASIATIVVELLSALQNTVNCERMRELVAAVGLDRLRERAGAGLAAPRAIQAAARREYAYASDSAASTRTAQPASKLDPIAGVSRLGSKLDDATWLEFGLAFGSGERATWDTLAHIAEHYGSGEVRITPFRTVILPDIAAAQRTAALGLAEHAGWIVDPSDPLLRAAACPGAPACASARGETRALARELAPLLGAGETLHVSGCAKGCAQSDTASITVVRATHDCSFGFGLTAAETAEAPRLALADARAALAQRSRDSHARSLARDPSTVQARELRQQ